MTHVLDILVQSRRNKQAAKKFFKSGSRLALCAPRADHGQTQELRRREARGDAGRRASAASLPQQPV